MKRVLVASRGEIALRIIRACHEEGLEAVAVHSDGDRLAAHVRAADAAARLGASTDAYDDVAALIAAARATGADTIHPGYGHLAERPACAVAAQAAGLTFAGPPADVIAALGDAAAVRARVAAAGIAVTPEGAVAPQRRRHIELQVLADREGRVAHLGEREASIQARGRKLLAESPSPVMDSSLRRAFGDAAVRAAETVGLLGAGTCVFHLLPDGEFQFVALSPRISADHPLTELVYGFDIVRQQLRIARGEPLTLPKRALIPRGWAVACRVAAEDPTAGFRRATGRVAYLRLPGGPGVRWDGWIEQGSVVSADSDPLIGKVIAWAGTRERALARAARALEELIVAGLATTRELQLALVRDPSIGRGEVDLAAWDRLEPELLRSPPEVVLEAAAVAAFFLAERAP